VYKVDFEAERKSREDLNDQRLKLHEKLIAAEEELQTLKVANQIAEHHHHIGYAPARHTIGLAEEMPMAMGNVYQQQRIAQEHSAPATAAAAAAALPVPMATVEPQLANRTTVEVSLTLPGHQS